MAGGPDPAGVGFAVIAFRMWWQSGLVPPHSDFETEPATPYPPAAAWARRAIVLAAVMAAFGLAWVSEASVSAWRWPLVAVVLGATIVSAPIFVLLGGLAVVLFYADGVTIMSVPAQTLQIVSQPTLPTIPLFTLAGTLLASGERRNGWSGCSARWRAGCRAARPSPPCSPAPSSRRSPERRG